LLLISFLSAAAACPPRQEPAQPATPKFYHPSEMLEDAHRMAFAGHTTAAIELLWQLQARYPNNPLARDLDYLIANFAELIESDKLALIHYDRVIENGGPLVEEALVGAARVQKRRGNNEFAISLLKYLIEKYPDFALVGQAKRDYAELLFKTEDYKKAYKLFSSLAREFPREAYHLWRKANCAQELENLDEAAKLYRKLWRSFPRYRHADEAYNRLKGLGKAGVGHTDRLSRADAYMSAGKFDRALKLYRAVEDAVANTSAAGRYLADAIYGQAKVFFKRRKYKEAEKHFSRYMKLRLSAAKNASGTFMLARSRARQEKLSLAQKTYRQVADNYAFSSLADDSLYNAALLSKYMGRPLEAAEIMKSVPERFPRGDMKENAVWNTGWLYYLAGQYSEAYEWFKRAERTFTRVRMKEKAIYWRGRVLEKLGRTDEAVSEYRRLMGKYNLGYHSEWARTRLRSLGKISPGEFVPAIAVYEFPTDVSEATPRILTEMEKSKVLDRLGMVEQASAVRERMSKEWIGNPALAYEIASQLYFDGKFNESQYLVWQNLEPYFWNDDRSVLYENVWALGYPRAFSTVVTERVEDLGMNEYIVYSVMREESRFQPDVVSWAGAYGLMQLIIPTAKVVARQISLKDFDLQMLYRPEINIAMGSRYLNDLIEDFNGNVYYALGGYNGGPHNIKRWLKQKPDLELDEFLEDIPYNETRYYVKKVMRSFYRYNYVNAKDDRLRLVEVPVNLTVKKD
jgi:peptidoglycan lytic transglycosylase